ncbi:MAG: hydrogenase maturation nickel metallochaperone HypA [Desulfovibrio sp.]|nr:hydrogenase maturation nickel metallochaperone HypA [Desulfovibrio sp.]
MHEASLVQGLIDLVMKTVAEHNEGVEETKRIRRIEEVVCELGLYSCVEPVTLSSCFELFAENTLLHGAKLTIKRSKLSCRCLDCGTAFTVLKRNVHCPSCNSENIHFDGGHGLVLLSLRVDTEE